MLGGVSKLWIVLSTVVLLGFWGTASARPKVSDATIGCPVQPVTVVNNAGIRPAALAKFEVAMVAQAKQVRQAWGTPCIQFGPVGWYLYLEPSVTGFSGHFAPGFTEAPLFFPQAVCVRRPDPMQACAQTWVGTNWTENASHELVETLVDPSMQGVEVCDPVEQWAYRMRGVWVSDFIRPNGTAF